MSASKKLGALGRGIHTPNTPEWFAAHDMVVYALPQIIALVEAAEGLEGELPIDQGAHDMLYLLDLRAALAALDEELG